MSGVIAWCNEFAFGIWSWFPPLAQYLLATLGKIGILTLGVILIVAYSTYFERKVIGSMQARVGPNRVGPLGLLQPFADVFKLLFKEVIIPSESSRYLFITGRRSCLSGRRSLPLDQNRLLHTHR